MYDELAARQRAISLRLAGRPVKHICLALGRSEAWFHKWWDRHLEAGPAGLYDLTRANHHVVQRIPLAHHAPAAASRTGHSTCRTIPNW